MANQKKLDMWAREIDRLETLHDCVEDHENERKDRILEDFRDKLEKYSQAEVRKRQEEIDERIYIMRMRIEDAEGDERLNSN